MSDLWLGDFGIRVTNLERSVEFYTKLLDLEELKRAADDDSAYVLFRDRRSGQRFELNWYADTSPFAAPYVPGEALDHIEVRVKSVPEILKRLRARGIEPATRKLWVNRDAINAHRADSEWTKLMEEDVWITKNGHRIVYIQDPDGIFLCLYDHPEEEWDGPIPDHY